MGAARTVVCRCGTCWFFGYAGESLLLPPSRSLRVWGRWVGAGGAVRRRWISSEVVGSRNSIRMFQTPSVSSKSNLSPGPSNIAPSSVADNGGASVTMKNQCVAVRGAHRPSSPIVKTGALLLGPSAPCRTCRGRPHFGSGPLGRGLTTSCQQPWESCVTVLTLASDRGTSGGRSSYAAAKSPACVSYQSCMSWSSHGGWAFSWL